MAAGYPKEILPVLRMQTRRGNRVCMRSGMNSAPSACGHCVSHGTSYPNSKKQSSTTKPTYADENRSSVSPPRSGTVLAYYQQPEKAMARTLCVLLLMTVATVIGSSQGTPSEYVSPSEAIPRGTAPKMQVQLLNPGESAKQYAVIFYQGDEALSGLLEFAEKYQVKSAHFTAIGALNGATLGWFDPQRKMYKKIPVVGQHEVVGMSGDIALYKGNPVVHTHMIVGSPDGTTLAGHVLAAYVSPTLEVMVTVDPTTMQKRFDPATDLTLIDPALK
jgi:predicted DNA-binding protein with PD1-like motif